jgi:hypothetical protein
MKCDKCEGDANGKVVCVSCADHRDRVLYCTLCFESLKQQKTHQQCVTCGKQNVTVINIETRIPVWKWCYEKMKIILPNKQSYDNFIEIITIIGGVVGGLTLMVCWALGIMLFPFLVDAMHGDTGLHITVIFLSFFVEYLFISLLIISCTEQYHRLSEIKRIGVYHVVLYFAFFPTLYVFPYAWINTMYRVLEYSVLTFCYCQFYRDAIHALAVQKKHELIQIGKEIIPFFSCIKHEDIVQYYQITDAV